MSDIMNEFAQLRTNSDFRPEMVEDTSILSDDNHILIQEAIIWRPEFAEFFIENGAPVDRQDNKGRTALQYSIARLHNNISLSLLKKGSKSKFIRSIRQ